MIDSQKPDAPENSGDNAESNEGRPDQDSPLAATALPKCGGKNCYADQKKTNWTEIFAFIAALGGIFAAIAGGYQGLIARDAERITSRAYITSTAFQLVHYGEKSVTGHVLWELSPIIENSGNTSTRFLKLKAGIAPGPGPAWSFEKAMDSIATTEIVLAPKTQVLLPSKFTYWLGVPSVMFPIISVGTATYRDVFGDPHITRFCYAFLLNQPIDWDNYPIGQPIRIAGVAAPQCDKHNCEDEECGADWKKLATE